MVKKIQNYFYFPQEIEYVVEKGKIYVTNVKPFTDIANLRRKILTKGIPVNSGIVTGPVRLINNQNFINVKNSEIIVTKNIDKSLYNKIRKAKGIITDAIFRMTADKMHYKKMIKAPTIVAAKNATKLLQNGNVVTLNGITGEVYLGGFM